MHKHLAWARCFWSVSREKTCFFWKSWCKNVTKKTVLLKISNFPSKNFIFTRHLRSHKRFKSFSFTQRAYFKFENYQIIINNIIFNLILISNSCSVCTKNHSSTITVQGDVFWTGEIDSHATRIIAFSLTPIVQCPLVDTFGGVPIRILSNPRVGAVQSVRTGAGCFVGICPFESSDT